MSGSFSPTLLKVYFSALVIVLPLSLSPYEDDAFAGSSFSCKMTFPGSPKKKVAACVDFRQSLVFPQKSVLARRSPSVLNLFPSTMCFSRSAAGAMRYLPAFFFFQAGHFSPSVFSSPPADPSSRYLILSLICFGPGQSAVVGATNPSFLPTG